MSTLLKILFGLQILAGIHGAVWPTIHLDEGQTPKYVFTIDAAKDDSKLQLSGNVKLTYTPLMKSLAFDFDQYKFQEALNIDKNEIEMFTHTSIPVFQASVARFSYCIEGWNQIHPRLIISIAKQFLEPKGAPIDIFKSGTCDATIEPVIKVENDDGNTVFEAMYDFGANVEDKTLTQIMKIKAVADSSNLKSVEYYYEKTNSETKTMATVRMNLE